MPDGFDRDANICRRIRRLADRDPRRAVPLARRALEQLHDDEPLSRAWAQYTLGYVLLCWERFELARPCLQQALSIFTSVGDVALQVLLCEHGLLLADLW